MEKNIIAPFIFAFSGHANVQLIKDYTSECSINNDIYYNDSI